MSSFQLCIAGLDNDFTQSKTYDCSKRKCRQKMQAENISFIQGIEQSFIF